MKTISAGLNTHMQQAVTSLCTCWLVTRQDGVIFGFTDHDEDILYNGVNYVAQTGFLRSAISNTATAQVSELEVNGFLDSASLTEVDLRAGLFDYAEVRLFMLNWADLTQGEMKLRKGLFGECTITSTGQFKIELRGLVQRLSQTVGRTYQQPCDADLGDKRCTVVVAPPERLANTTYAIGDRTVVLSSSPSVAAGVPIVNGSFGSVSSQTLAGWVLESNIIVAPRDPNLLDPTGMYALITTDWIASFKSITRTLVDSTGNAVNAIARAYANGINFSIWFGAESQFGGTAKYTQFRMVVNFYDASATNIGTQYILPSYDLTLNNTSPYLLMPPSGTVSFDVEVQLRKWTTAATSGINFEVQYATYIEKMSVKINDVNQPEMLANPTFEISSSAAALTPTGWNGAGGIAQSVTVKYGLYAKVPGGRFLTWTYFAQGTAYSDPAIPLVGLAGLSTADLDSGLYVITTKWLQANTDLVGEGRVRPVFYTTTSVSYPPPIASEIPDYYKPFQVMEWEDRENTIAIPAGARYVRFWVESRIAPDVASSPYMGIDVVYDEISAVIKPAAGLKKSFLLTDGVEYEAQTAGTSSASASSALSFSRTLNDTLVDGGVTWKTIAPKWVFLGTIATVSSRGIFTVTGANGHPDEFYRWGVCEFLTGPAVGVKRDIFQHAGTTITLAIPSPVRPVVGNKVLLVAGCDKLISTCSTKFQNQLNHRGFPFMPGTNQYFKVGTPKS